MRARAALPALAAVGVLLAACGHGTGTTQAGSSTPPSSSQSGAGGSTVSGSEVPPFPANTEPDTGQASPDARGNVTDIRASHQDGFDRVVFEFSGPGTPGWNVQYVPQASSQGSGQPIALAGNAVLSVVITGVGYPTETGLKEYPRGKVTVSGTDAVADVFFDGTFEGQSQAFVGTAAKTPFRVYLLNNPARVVLEVRQQ